MTRVYPRKFDWDEARRLRDQGLSYAAIGQRLGVSETAVWRVISEDRMVYTLASNARRQTSGTCHVCGAPCSHNATQNRRGGRQPDQDLCRSCANTTSVRPTTLKCSECGDWYPDDAFWRNRANPHRRGRHQSCKACGVARRKAYRVLHPDQAKAENARNAERRKQQRQAAA